MAKKIPTTQVKKEAVKINPPEPARKVIFEAKVSNPKKVQLIFEVAAALVNEVVMKCGKNGITVDTIDSSRIGMLSVNLTRSFFETYKNGFGEFDWCMDIGDLMKILKRCSSKDELQIYRDEDTMDYLQVRIIKGKKQRTFKLKNKVIQTVLNDGEDEQKERHRLVSQIRELAEQVKSESKAKFMVDTPFLSDIIKDAEIVSDLILMEADKGKNQIVFAAYDDAGEFESILDANESYVKKSIIKDDAEGFYPLNYISSVLKLSPIVEGFDIGIGDTQPLLIMCQFVKDEGKLAAGEPGYFTFLLAPRVDGEIEDEDFPSDNELNDAIAEAQEDVNADEFTEEDFENNIEE